MKRVITGIAACLLMTACGTQKHAEIKFESISSEYTEERTVDASDSVDYTNITVAYKFNFTLPTACSNAKLLSALQKEMIANTCGEDYVDMTPAKAVESFADDMKQSEVFGPEGSFECNSQVLFDEADLLQYVVNRYSYDGGAHGLSTVNYCTFDLKELQAVHNKDIFSPDDSANIAGLLMAACDVIKQKKPDFQIFNDMFFISDNLRFNRDGSGLTFYYNPYEIAPYATGAVELTVPYVKLLPFLKDDSPVRAFFETYAKK